MTPVDPAREKVERADEVVREVQESVIDDPTVFVKSAGLGALTLVALSKLAQRSTDAGVRALADQVRLSQDAILKELRAVAGRKRLDVPTSLVYQDEQMLGGAEGKSGADFDAWFVQQTIVEHLKSATLYEAARKMKDAQLAAFAAKTLPVLEADRQKASDVALAAAR